MTKFLEKNLTIILLGVTSYFLFSISSNLKESAKYHSEIRVCAKMKTFSNNKETSKLFQQKASATTGIGVDFINEYCKKLTQQNIF